jgi:hypothetical protein
MMVDRAVTVIGPLYFWDVSREEVETYSIWQDRLEADRGFEGLDLTETPLQGRIQDSGFDPFWEFSLGFHERRMQTGCVGSTMMIRVVQRRHGGTFPRLVWDRRIIVLDSSTTIREESTDFDFPEFSFGRLRSGCLEEWSPEEFTEFMQLMIA